MNTKRLKAWMPRSLYWRSALILLVPVLTILLVVGVVFFQRLYEGVTRQMTEGVVQEAHLILNLLEDDETLHAIAPIATPLGIEVTLGIDFEEDRRRWIDWSGTTVIAVLKEGLPGLLAVDLESRNGRARLAFDNAGQAITMDVPRNRLSARNPHQFLVLIGFTALLMTAIALLYLRNQVRPIRRLALASEAFGKGRNVPYRPTGASEVRRAGTAFLDMRDRIERQIEQRTMMLSGVSHDLKTPLTRMKLGLSLMESDTETEALQRDVKEMERMLTSFLEFAKGNALEEPQRIDPTDIVQSVVENASRNQPVEVGEISGKGTTLLRPIAIRRALDNLVTNAVRYGKLARVNLSIEENALIFSVEDRGPGIPPEKRADVLQPFTRLDSSRNQNTGLSVGLGLAIASDIARQHGGTLNVGDSHDLGGAKVEIVIPR